MSGSPPYLFSPESRVIIALSKQAIDPGLRSLATVHSLRADVQVGHNTCG